MNKTEKQGVVSAFSEKLAKAKAVFVTEYRGLKVSEITALRSEIKKNQADIQVVKNRLVKRAIQETGWSPLGDQLKGPLAYILSAGDPVVVSKVLAKFAEDFEALKLKAGCMDGKVLDAKAIQALAKLPSREELYARLLGTLQAPISGMVRVLNGVPQKLAIALKAVSEKKQ